MKIFNRLMTVTLLALLSLTGTAWAQSDRDLPDETIKAIVERRIMREGLQRSNNVRVTVDDNIVTLRGTVRNQAEKRRIERLARNVDDVTRVENQLEVARSDRSDQQIADEVAKEIRSFAFFDVFDWVEGEVRNGVLTLRGAVREPWRKDDYGRLAENVAGVREVNNEIRVLPNSMYDDQIRVAVARQLYGDPRFVRYANRSLPPIHIIVENGRVWLKGAVATQLEKQLAESIVRSSVLSFEVTNDLRVDSEMEAHR